MAGVLDRIAERRAGRVVTPRPTRGLMLWRPKVEEKKETPRYRWNAQSAGTIGTSHAASFRSFAQEGFARNALIYAAVMYKARAQRLAPLRAYTGDYEHRTLLPREHPLQRLLLRPNEHESWLEFNQKNIVYLNLSGNVFIHILRDEEGMPIEMHSYRPDHVRIVPGEPGKLLGYYYVPEGMEPEDRRLILPEDMIHINLPNPLDPFEGLGYGQSPITPMAEAGDVDNAATSFLKDFFENGAMVASLLEYDQDLDEADLDFIKRRWRERYGGWQNWSDVVVLGSGGKYQRIGLTFEEMGFDALDERNESRILGPLGVPPILLFTRVGLERSTHSNYEQAREQFWKDTFLPELMLFEVEFQHYLNREDAFVAFDLTNVPGLREDIAEKVDAWQTLVSWGVPKNVAAETVGLALPELSDGRVGYMPLNYVETTQESILPRSSPIGAEEQDGEEEVSDVPKARAPFRLRRAIPARYRQPVAPSAGIGGTLLGGGSEGDTGHHQTRDTEGAQGKADVQ